MKKVIKNLFVALSVGALVLGSTACGSKKNTETGSKKLTLVLDWTPNTNHTGFYVAMEKGYYKDAGIELEIVQPPEDGAEVLVASGKANFGVSFQDTMAGALSGDNALPIKAVAAITQHNTSGIMSRKDDGITSPKGLEGKNYATWDMPIEKAMLKNVVEKDGGDFSKVNLIPSTVTDEVSALSSKQVVLARLRYSTIENWSKNMYNLNTKRAVVEEGGRIEWVSGSFGSHVSYLYPMSILKGRGARMEFTGITFAGAGQNLDTGSKVVHAAPDTSSFINTKSISKGGGISTFRNAVVVSEKAKNSKSAVSCESLMLDDISRSDTVPAMDIRCADADIGHEARIGRISDDAVFYLMNRGISEEDAKAMIVSGFADNVSKELPIEYAVEMNNLIQLEMKGSIG